MEHELTGPPWLDARLKRGEVVILDGAMGTELEARGVPMDGKAWSGAAMLEHGAAVRQVHADYIRAGADVIITNSFATGRHALEPAGFGAEVAEINRRAVTLAREAREEAADRPVSIAGSICSWVPVEESGWRAPDRLAASLGEQADLLAEAGVDLIALEMCQSAAETHLSLAAAQATGLPVWLGTSCRRREGAGGLLTTHDEGSDPDFEALVADLAGRGPAVMTVMHSPIQDTADGLAAVKRHWSGPLGAYPESGYFVMPNWQFVDIVAPQDLLAEARQWVAAGAQLIGGCCGLGPDHIRALKQGLPEKI
jgi:homocysteine S-methyltransferase